MKASHFNVFPVGVMFAVCSILNAQFPPRYAFSPPIKDEVRSIDGSVKAVAPRGWSTKFQTFGTMPDVGVGEGYSCAYSGQKRIGKTDGLEEAYFSFKIYNNADLDCVAARARSRKLHPWLNFPFWSHFHEKIIRKPTKTFVFNRLEYLPPHAGLKHKVFSDQIFIAFLGEKVLVAYFYGGESRIRQEQLFFKLWDVLKAANVVGGAGVDDETALVDMVGAQPKTVSEALSFLNRWMSLEEKNAILAAFGHKAASLGPAILLDGSMLSPYLVPFQNGRCSWEDWMCRHWGLSSGDSPLARSLEEKGVRRDDEMVLFIMKEFDSYLASVVNAN